MLAYLWLALVLLYYRPKIRSYFYSKYVKRCVNTVLCVPEVCCAFLLLRIMLLSAFS